MGNVGSLGNKMDKLRVLFGTPWSYWKCSVLNFIEKCLHKDVLDVNASIPGFQTVNTNRTIDLE